MAPPQSRTQADLQARLEQLPEGSARRGAVAAASRFKSSWVDLGQALLKVRQSGEHKAWGYTSFESYCSTELHIKADTMRKLVRSFTFLQNHAPTRLSSHEAGAAAPALDVVDLLSQAAARTKVSQEALDSIGQEVFGSDAATSRTDVLKRLRQDDPEAFRRGKATPAAEAAEPGATDPARAVDLRKALLLAERLCGLLGGQQAVVSDAAQQNLQRVVQELRAAQRLKTADPAQRGDANLVQHGQMH